MIQRIEADGTTPEFEKEKNKLLAFAAFVMQYRDVYYDLSRLLCIACTLPVTSAEAERSFKCVKLIKTHLRTNLSLLSLHSDRVNALDLDRVIDMFAVLSYTALCLNFKHCGV